MRNAALWCVCPVLTMVLAGILLAAYKHAAPAIAAAQGTITQTAATTAASRPGREAILLNELVDLYEPVPFSHKAHAAMAEMWDGCTTCHHHTPTAASKPATQPAAPVVLPAAGHASKDDAAKMPACKSCHAIAAKDVDIHMPSLKGAYHRQCLNCHRDWMEQNACNVCHAPRKNNASGPATATAPSADDILGRMHKPIPEPTTTKFVARFTPAAGANVLFRHDEHTKTFGIKCVSCHRHDACASCHTNGNGATQGASATRGVATLAGDVKPIRTAAPPRVMHTGRTWRAAHEPCITCHQDDKCSHCHYEDKGAPPRPFDHGRMTQTLDKDHASLACVACHAKAKPKEAVTCGESNCHKSGPVAYPARKPGPLLVAVARPTTLVAVQAAPPATSPSTTPSTRPVITRIRRGGL